MENHIICAEERDLVRLVVFYVDGRQIVRIRDWLLNLIKQLEGTQTPLGKVWTVQRYCDQFHNIALLLLQQINGAGHTVLELVALRVLGHCVLKLDLFLNRERRPAHHVLYLRHCSRPYLKLLVLRKIHWVANVKHDALVPRGDGPENIFLHGILDTLAKPHSLQRRNRSLAEVKVNKLRTVSGAGFYLQKF